ncbi:hypothetical protein EPI10_005865 [Gossypium australe]|uniref:Uncharacterized protein n=1 Tax=Gossypium australe TaxID=47621 RepID=A0A5B6WS42_9ROSI|nr:hypothetical protein EPI10_005865 [Gossypium australe]
MAEVGLLPPASSVNLVEPSSLVFLIWERQQVYNGDQKPIENVYGKFVANSRRWLLIKIGPTLEFNRSWDENGGAWKNS